MIIHCTAKLAKKLPLVSSSPLPETSPLGSWHGHLYCFDRRQCVIFCHDPSRYALFLSGLRKPQFSALGDWFIDIFLATIEAEGFERDAIAQVAKSLGPIRFDRATNASVLSATRVISESVQAMRRNTASVLELDQTAVSLHLSHRPTSILKRWVWPDKIMAEMVMALQADGKGH